MQRHLHDQSGQTLGRVRNTSANNLSLWVEREKHSSALKAFFALACLRARVLVAKSPLSSTLKAGMLMCLCRPNRVQCLTFTAHQNYVHSPSTVRATHAMLLAFRSTQTPLLARSVLRQTALTHTRQSSRSVTLASSLLGVHPHLTHWHHANTTSERITHEGIREFNELRVTSSAAREAGKASNWRSSWMSRMDAHYNVIAETIVCSSTAGCRWNHDSHSSGRNLLPLK